MASPQHNQFYITLPSNSVKYDVGVENTENTASSFRIKLPQRVRLDGEWEVGLAELIYPNTWMNLPNTNNQNVMTLRYQPTREMISVAIPAGRYETVEELVETIENTLMQKSRSLLMQHGDKHVQLKMGISFRLDKETKRVVMSLIPSVVKKVEMSNHLMYMLGLTRAQMHAITDNDEAKDVEAASKVPDLRAGFECLYVYCDICELQFVGNYLAPLLRVVNVQGKYGEVVDCIYDTPHYVPVLVKDITCIEVNIKNDMNEFVAFAYGKVVVKLHFRRKKPLLLF